MRSSELARFAIACAVAFSFGCPGPRSPRDPGAQPLAIEIGRDGGSLRGVAGDDAQTYAAVTLTGATGPAVQAPSTNDPGAPVQTVIEARRGAKIAWHVDLDGAAGPLAVSASGGPASASSRGAASAGSPSSAVAGASGPSLFVSLGGSARVAGGPVRGEPGGAVVALDRANGAVRWRVALDASEWTVINAIAGTPGGGVVVGGAFSGSLRIGARVVTSAGKGDGFVAELAPTGELAWLVRMGGASADSVQGVAARGDRIAIAGMVSSGADLLGQPLPSIDDKTPYADAFVAELDRHGTRVWASTFGSKLDDSVAGVAIDEPGRVVVAATARDVVHVGGAELSTQGPGDALVAWWGADGTQLHAILIGGDDFDGLRAITAVGSHVVIGGFFSGALQLGDRALTAGGGDDAFLAELDEHGSVLAAWPVAGPGREEITALATIPGGVIAGIAHTASATVDGEPLPSPHDPMSGAALAVRAVR